MPFFGLFFRGAQKLEPRSDPTVPNRMNWTPDRTAALAALEDFAPRAGRAYADTRNFDDGPERTNVSQLSPWLHAGLLSEAEVIDRVPLGVA